MITIDPNPEVPWLGWIWCHCCGVRVMLKPNIRLSEHRCSAHRGRNPCAIERCMRTTKAPLQETADPGCFVRVLALDQWICAEHWRMGCPPRSPERRIYHRFFRRARRYGWNDQNSAAFWRVWNRIVANAQARCRGDIDEAEIKRMFGWDQAA